MLPDDLIIIGSKNIEVYAFAILMVFETKKEIILSANMNHASKMERLIKLFRIHGVEEQTREKNTIKKGDKQIVRLKVTLARV